MLPRSLQCGESKHSSGIMFQEPDIDLIDPREEHQFYGGEKFDYNGFYNDLESDPLLLLLREANTSATPFVTLETPEYERWEGFIKSPSSFSSSYMAVHRAPPLHSLLIERNWLDVFVG